MKRLWPDKGRGKGKFLKVIVTLFFFHAVSNHRRRKKQITGLEGPDGMVEDNKGMLDIVVDYYE
jgi:hypothetical protein